MASLGDILRRSQNENKNKRICDCSKSIFMTTSFKSLSGNVSRSGILGETLTTFLSSSPSESFGLTFPSSEWLF